MTEEQILSEIMKSEESLLKYRKKAQTDFIWFITYVLGYRDVAKLKLLREESIPLLLQMLGDFPHEQAIEPYMFFELPRNTFKTTIFSVSLMLWLICRDPNIRIGLCSWNKDTAYSILKEVAEHGEENRVLRVLFRYIFPDNPRDKNGAKVWRMDAFQVLRTASYKEATVEAFSINRQKTGRHYDIVIADDVVDESNVVSDAAIQAVKDKFRLIFSILNIGCPMIVVGTRYNYSDLYGDLESDDGIGAEFVLYKRGAHNADGKLNFPERLTEEFLERQRIIQGDYISSCQYELTPVNPKDTAVDISGMKYYDKIPKNVRFVYKGAVDTSFSTTSGSDPSVGVLFAVNQDTGYKYLIRAFRKRVRSDMLISEIMKLGEQGAIKGQCSLDIEAVAAAKEVLDRPLRARLEQTGNRFTFTLRKGYSRRYQGGSKNEKPRIPILFSQHLQTTYFPKKLLIYNENGEVVDFMDILRTEAAEYPYSRNDDCLDATALAFLSMPTITHHNQQKERQKVDKFGMWGHTMNNTRRRYVSVED